MKNRKIKQCSVYIANAGDQLPCLSSAGALLASVGVTPRTPLFEGKKTENQKNIITI